MTQQPISSKTRKAIPLRELRTSTSSQASIESHKELVRLAKPLYVEMLSSVPFYRDRINDEQFWHAYIGSRVTAARELVARSQAASTKAT